MVVRAALSTNVYLAPARDYWDNRSMNRLIALQAETVIVADDHPLFRTAIKEALEAEQGETTFLEASSFETLQELVDSQK